MLMQKFQQFMYGRNGYDKLCLALVITSLALNIVNWFFNFKILSLISFLLFGFCIFRMLSRNVYQRQKENMWFERMLWKTKNFWVGLKSDFEERKTYCHFKCPGCRQKIRIPRGRGKVEITCPKCGKKFVKKA